MHIHAPRRVMAARHARVLPLVLSALSLGACATAHTRAAAEPRRLPALVGTWALVSEAGAGSVRDTALWEIAADGRIRYAEVHHGRVRGLSYARWWTETQRLEGDTAARIMCVAARGGRGRQCGRVRVDTVAAAGETGRRRLTWDGTTARRRHWIFVERRP